jgi:ankyrin repeat protein
LAESLLEGLTFQSLSLSSAGESPLHLAVTSDEAKMAMLLLEKGASVGSRDSEGLTPLHRAAQSSDDKGCISMLIKAGAGTLSLKICRVAHVLCHGES